jgi:hypothetical protein
LQDHLGHDPRTSEENYRKSLAAVELTKVATALCLAEQGRLTDFKGKKFEELTLDPQKAEPLQGENDDPLADFAISDDNEDEVTGDESDDTDGPPKK